MCTKPLVAGREPFPETGPELDVPAAAAAAAAVAAAAAAAAAAAVAAAASSPRRVASSDVRQETDPVSMSPASCKIKSSLVKLYRVLFRVQRCRLRRKPVV